MIFENNYIILNLIIIKVNKYKNIKISKYQNIKKYIVRTIYSYSLLT